MEQCETLRQGKFFSSLLDTLTNGRLAPEKANFLVIIKRTSTDFLSTVSQHKARVTMKRNDINLVIISRQNAQLL